MRLKKLVLWYFGTFLKNKKKNKRYNKRLYRSFLLKITISSQFHSSIVPAGLGAERGIPLFIQYSVFY